MLRTYAGEVSLWEAVLPDEVLRLPEELARVDALVDDPAFFAPFVPFFDPRIGRPSTPMETYLRLMFLKFRYRLGYESLCREVSDSISWRMFCRIPLDVSVPHPTTLMKLTTPPTGYAQTRRWCRRTWPIRPIRACWRRRCAGSPRRVSGSRPPAARRVAGCGTGRGRRASGAHALASKLRPRAAVGREEATAAVLKSTGELAGLAETAARDAERLLVNAQRAVRRATITAAQLRARGEHDAAAGRRRGRLVRAVNDRQKLLAATRQIAAQTRQRVSGQIPDGATGRVRLHDGDARP